MTSSGYVFSRTFLSLPLKRSPRKQRLIIVCSEKVAFSSEVLQAEIRYYTCMHVTEKNNQPTIELKDIVTWWLINIFCFVRLFVFFLLHSGKGKEKAKKQQKVNMIRCTCSCLLFVGWFRFFLCAFTDWFVFQPAEKPADRAKKDAAKDKAKTKPSAATKENKKTDKNAEKRAKEEEATLEKDADELHKAIEGRYVFPHCITRNTFCWKCGHR